MPALTSDKFIEESDDGLATSWISDASHLSQFSAFVEVLQPALSPR